MQNICMNAQNLFKCFNLQEMHMWGIM